MKILVLLNYYKQHAVPCNVFCLSKTILVQLRIQVMDIPKYTEKSVIVKNVDPIKTNVNLLLYIVVLGYW